MKLLLFRAGNRLSHQATGPSFLIAELAAPLLSALLLLLSFNWIWGRFLAGWALVPLLAAAASTSRARAFRRGLMTGFVFYFIELQWIGNAIANYTRLSGLQVDFVLVLLALYLGLYFAIFVAFWQFFSNSAGKRAGFLLPALAAAAAWVLLEDVRSCFLGGFPWHPLGLTQVDMPGVRELFAYGGVRLVSALVILVNIGLYLLLTGFQHNRPRPRYGLTAVLLIFSFIAAIFLMPEYKLPPTHFAGVYGTSLRVTIIQPDIKQAEKWQREKQSDIIKKILAMSALENRAATDLMVWPEASLPLFLKKKRQVRKKLVNFARRYDLHLMVGGPDFDKPTRNQNGAIYNSAFLIAPDGSLQIYNKVKLVPFGEVTPLAAIFPFLDKVVPGPDYTPGIGARNFLLEGQKFAPSICFEGVFPVFVARFFAAGAGFLVNQTNDAWFGNSAGPAQHLTNLRLRALENRCYIVRSANTGISAIIDPCGKICQQLPINQAGALKAVIYPLLKPTFYARHPDLPTIIAVLLLLSSLISILVKSR